MISKLLGQSILGMRHLPRISILVCKKDWLRQGRSIYLVSSSKSIIREKVNVWSQNQNDRKPRNNYFVKIEQP